MPRPRKSSEVSVVIEPFRMNGMKVSVADHGVRQEVAEHEPQVADAERARRLHVAEIPRAQELRAHQPDQRHPGEEEQDAEQHEEARHQHRGDDEQQIERGDRRPDLDEALEEEIDAPAEIALRTRPR